MKLSALKGKEQKVRIQVPSNEEGTPDEEVEVVYRPGVLTIDVFERVTELSSKNGGDVSMVAELLSNVLVSWDLEEDLENGQTQKLGISVEDIRKVPLPFLGQVLDKITRAVTPTPQKDATSEERLPQEEPQVASPSGTS